MVNNLDDLGKQKELIRKTVAKELTDDEIDLFMYTAKRTGLDPLLHQIHAIKRTSGEDGRAITILTGINGYRLIAERTDKYAPGREPTFVYGKDGGLISATAYVKKLCGGSWHEVAATAFYAEYVQTKKDGSINRMWKKMAHVMLSKCAEALALRRAFPAELSGVYTFEEMEQSENVIEKTSIADENPIEETKKISGEDVFIPLSIEKKSGISSKGPWTKYGIKHPDGRIFGTFSEDFSVTAEAAINFGKELRILWEQKGKFLNITGLSVIGDAQDSTQESTEEKEYQYEASLESPEDK